MEIIGVLMVVVLVVAFLTLYLSKASEENRKTREQEEERKRILQAIKDKEIETLMAKRKELLREQNKKLLGDFEGFEELLGDIPLCALGDYGDEVLYLSVSCRLKTLRYNKIQEFTGDLIITDKCIHFDGKENNFTIKLKHIVSSSIFYEEDHLLRKGLIFLETPTGISVKTKDGKEWVFVTRFDFESLNFNPLILKFYLDKLL